MYRPRSIAKTEGDDRLSVGVIGFVPAELRR
jgi:hypothetical protein